MAKILKNFLEYFLEATIEKIRPNGDTYITNNNNENKLRDFSIIKD